MVMVGYSLLGRRLGLVGVGWGIVVSLYRVVCFGRIDELENCARQGR